MRTATRRVDKRLEAAKSNIMRWREGGPVLFAQEALGMPAHYDKKEGRGCIDWWYEASEKLVKTGRLSIRSGHGVSKSAFLAITVIWFESCYFPSKIPCTAPTAHQLGDVLWAEIAKWLRQLQLTMPELSAQFEWTRDEFRLKDAPKESFAVARTARADKPEAFAGFHSDNMLIIADEASGIPDVIFEVGQGALSGENTFVILASNPTRRSGFFFDSQHKFRDRWSCMTINGEDCELVSKQFIEDIAYQYGRDSNVFRVRVQGEFPNSEDDVVIPLDLCEEAKIREVTPFGDTVWGVDVARFGSDRTVLVERCENATLKKHEAWNGTDLMQTAGRIYAKWLDTAPSERPKTIFVDVIGIGAGVSDRLMELGLPITAVNVAESPSINDATYNRLRDELWFKARKWLEKKNCKLFDDDTLVAELTLPKYAFTSSGKMKVESKDELRKRYPRSPDVADAFCMTFCHTAEHRGRDSYEPAHYADS
jgi:phage terminase large subunit